MIKRVLLFNFKRFRLHLLRELEKRKKEKYTKIKNYITNLQYFNATYSQSFKYYFEIRKYVFNLETHISELLTIYSQIKNTFSKLKIYSDFNRIVDVILNSKINFINIFQNTCNILNLRIKKIFFLFIFHCENNLIYY